MAARGSMHLYCVDGPYWVSSPSGESTNVQIVAGIVSMDPMFSRESPAGLVP